MHVPAQAFLLLLIVVSSVSHDQVVLSPLKLTGQFSHIHDHKLGTNNKG